MAGLYIHVPFCARRCVYCDFYSNTDRALVAPYIEALIREMELREDYLNGEAIETIYLGGGTPSLLREADLDRLFKAIDRLYGLGDAKEITIEGNPDDLHPDYVAQLKHLPINRISMGIQSFHDDDLRLLNRRHSAQQAIEAVENCVKAGLENISIDLIYGLPGQTPERWAKNLDTAISLQVPHLSAYHLTYEKGTPLDRMPFEREELSVHDQYDDYIITRTRTSWGLNPSEILTLFGQAYHDYFMCQATKAQTKGLLEIHDGNFRLTRAGIFISDSVMVELLSE